MISLFDILQAILTGQIEKFWGDVRHGHIEYAITFDREEGGDDIVVTLTPLNTPTDKDRYTDKD